MYEATKFHNHCIAITIIMLQMAPQFTWDSTISKFVGPAQKVNMEKAAVQSVKLEEDKQVCEFMKRYK